MIILNILPEISVSVFSLIPFVLMLAAIAILPLAANHFWGKNINKLIVGGVLSTPVIIYLAYTSLSTPLCNTMVFDYLPFIILLGSLFIITGGIFVDGDIEAKPAVNTLFLAIGAVLASFMGTTGAAMLLIRPIIMTNLERKFKTHTILFFIAIVANCGGLLTPLGDPPLFMLYLQGAPFEWFFNLLPVWAFTNGLLLVIYFFIDSFYYKRETIEDIEIDKTNIKPISINGKLNFIFLLGVILSVAFINKQYLSFISDEGVGKLYGFLREGVIALMAILSLTYTSKEIRASNKFSWSPMLEVVYLFLGIFITMVPCLLYLKTHAVTLGIETATQFYFTSGGLSSILDNTPTALTFHSLALGLSSRFDVLFNGIPLVAGIPVTLLKAISVGAVFFGSLTYIGNGPNFMVKAIAEENNIKMPHFFSYIFKFSILVLLPIFVLVYLIFI